MPADLNITGQVVISARGDDRQFMHGAPKYLDTRHLAGEVIGLNNSDQIDGVTVVIDTSDLRPGVDQTWFEELRQALSPSRGVVIRGARHATIVWLTNGLRGDVE